MKRIFVLFFTLVMLSGSTAWARTMPIYGQLDDQKTVDVSYKVRLYDKATGGTELYGDMGSVKIDEFGQFLIHAFDGAPASVFEVATHLELELDGQVLQPRVVLGYVPTAKVSDNALRLGGVEADQYMKKGQSIAYGDITDAPLPRGASAPLVLDGNQVAIGLCANGHLLIVDANAWHCKPLPTYGAGAGLMVQNNVFAIASGGVTSQMIAQAAINGVHINADAINNTHLQSNSVGSTELQDASVLDRHVVSIAPQKVSGTAAVLNGNVDQRFGARFAILPSQSIVTVGEANSKTTLDVSGDVIISGSLTRKSRQVKSQYISAAQFRGQHAGQGMANILLENSTLALFRSSGNGTYRMYAQLNVQPGDIIRRVTCYHKGYAFGATTTYGASLTETPFDDNTPTILSTRTGSIVAGRQGTAVVNSVNRTVKDQFVYGVALNMDATSGYFIGCSAEIWTHRF